MQQPADAAGGKAAGSRAASASAAAAAGLQNGSQQAGAAACSGGSSSSSSSSGTTAAAAAAEPPSSLLPYTLDASGRKQPLPGVRPLFLRGATVAALGLGAPPAASSSSGPGNSSSSNSSTTAGAAAAGTSGCMRSVPRELLLADVRFQGAISDFHVVKDALAAADYNPLLLAPLEDDEFEDGSNWQLALDRAAADSLLAADAAAAAAAAAAPPDEAAEVALEGLEAAACRGQRRPPRPWQDQGTEAELAAAGVLSASATAAAAAAGHAAARASGPAAGAGSSAALVLSRPRRAFGGALELSDAAAGELWSSSSMEARPFKDAGYELRRAVAEAAAQAVPQLREAAVQATGGRPRPACSQTSPQQLAAVQAEALLASDSHASFLADVLPRLEEALLQNAVGDVLADDLQLLGDDDPDSAAAGNASSGGGSMSASSVSGGSGRAAPGGSGSTGPSGAGAAGRPEHGGLIEAQSFTDLAFSKNKVVTALAWLPHRPGLVAAAMTDSGSMTDRLGSMGRLAPAHVLIWDARDPIHPEHVLESPHEVFCFQYNPANPDLIVGGCYNGQLVVWDTSSLAVGADRVSGPRASDLGGGTRGAAGAAAAAAGAACWDDVAGEVAATPVVRPKFMSAVEFSHTSCVTDVMWLPGLEVDRAGKVFAIRANSAGTSAQAFMRSMTLGATALAAANAGSNVPRECCFCASIAADGKVMFWDVRVEKLLKKGNKRLDDSELVWRPMHVVHLLSMAGSDFAGCCFTFDPFRLDSGAFTAGSLDGELLGGNFARAPGDEAPDHTHSLFAPHVGPLVALAPSPFLPELLLTADAWCWRLWAGADARSPLFASPFVDEPYTAAAWSPSRPGLLFLATAGGCLHVWDLLDRSHEPSLAPRLSGAALTSISFSTAPPKHATAAAAQEASGGAASGAAHTGGLQPQLGGGSSSSSQQLLAVGDAAGVLRVYELPRTLRRPLPNERRLMAAFVAREAAREQDVAARQPLRVEALKRQEAERRAAEDGGGMADAAGARDTLSAAGGSGGAWATAHGAGGARTSSVGGGLTSAGGGKAAAAPSLIISLSGGQQQPGRSSAAAAATGPRVSSAAGGSGAADEAAAAAEAAALDAEERQYRALAAQFRAQLGLAAPS